MKKNVSGIFTLICVLVCSLFTVSCTDKDYYDPDQDPIGLNASTLDFSTSQKVKLELNYDAVEGFVSTFDLYDDDPFKGGSFREDLKPIAAGINVMGYSQLSRVIPSYVTDLYVYSENLFVPLLSHAKIVNGVASFEPIDIETSGSIETRAGNAGNLGKSKINVYLKQQSDFYAETSGGNYMYDLINPDEQRVIAPEILTAIGNTFRESKIADEKYYKDATIKINKANPGQTGAEVFVAMLFSGASWNNSLSYFVYTGDKALEDLSTEEVEALEIINIFQYADVHTNSKEGKKGIKGLTPGKYVQLLYRNENGELVKEFPVGAQIGWALSPNAFQPNTFTVSEPTSYVAHRLFSVSYWNEPNKKASDFKETGRRTNNYNIFFSATDNEGYTYNCFGFEDNPQLGGDGDCNDVIFHVLTYPNDAIAPPPSITEEEIEKTEEKSGILAFEDNWPEKGDYDLNDLVVKYTSEIAYVYTVEKENGNVTGTSDATVKRVKDTFSFINNGATFNNKFSYKVNLSPNVIENITIIDPSGTGRDYNITSDGNGFIIDVADNPLKFEPAIVSVPQDYTVIMEFKEGMVSQGEFTEIAAPYNPFITPQGNNHNGAEIHLPMYAPTGRVNMDLFKTLDDRSNPSANLWYVSGENNKYPFAIHLAGAGSDFTIPQEEQQIHITYPRYTNWVESDMNEDKDWYLNK